MGGNSREERWANEECLDCGAKIEAGVRCKKHAKEHKINQEKRRRRKENDKECRMPGCKRKRVRGLTTCRECALRLKEGEVEDVVATYHDDFDAPWLRRKDGSSPARTLKKIREERASSARTSPPRAARARKTASRARKRS